MKPTHPLRRRSGKSSATSRQSDVWDGATIAAVRAGVPIQQVVAPRVPLRRAGAMLVGLCPFHEERTPSLKINTDMNTFHCFGCKAHGDVIDFVMRFDGLDFRTAVRDLARQAAIRLPDEQPSRFDGLYRCCEEAAAWFASRMPEATRRFLVERRGLSAETLASLRIGFAPENGGLLIEHLRTRGLSEEDMSSAGLCQRRGDDDAAGRPQAPQALLRGRVVFPITDTQNRVVAFGGRLVEGAEGPKYLNTHNSPIFEKSATAYGVPEAMRACRSRKTADGPARILLVEGYFDVAALRSAGIAGVVAACGTSASPTMMRNLFRFADEVIILFDPDGAGRNESRHAFLSGLSVMPGGKSIRVADIPGNLDPDEFVRRFGAESILQVATSAPDAAATLLEIADHDPASSAEAQTAAATRLAELVAAMPASAYREILASSLARRMDLTPSTFLDLVARAGAPVRSRRDGATSDQPRPDENGPVDVLAQCLLIDPGLPIDPGLLTESVRAHLLRHVRRARILMTLLDAIQIRASAPTANDLIDDLVSAGACTQEERTALYALTTMAAPESPPAAARQALSTIVKDVLRILQNEAMDRMLALPDVHDERTERLINADLDAMDDAAALELLMGAPGA